MVCLQVYIMRKNYSDCRITSFHTRKHRTSRCIGNRMFVMKRLIFMCAALLMCVVSVFAAQTAGSESVTADFLDGFKSFVGLATVVVPAVVGFIAGKLQNPMNRWVSMWVTAVVGVVVTFFSWWMDLGFPPVDASIWIVVIDALFVALASTGIVSVVTSEWLAKLFGGKVKNE